MNRAIADVFSRWAKLYLLRPHGRRLWLGRSPWLMLVILLWVPGQSQALQVIANPSTPVADLSVRELRAIYTMRLERWHDGTNIQVFVLPQKNSLHQQFCKSVLQALPHQLQAVWYRLVYSGMGRAPTEVRDEQEMLERIRTTPGAIGYVGRVLNVSDVQVLTIEAAHE